jgi:GNAT superfamily N-acetyltransferase
VSNTAPTSALRQETLHGARLRTRLADLAALRLAVFREWPYLYDGTAADEARYLEPYARSPQSLAVLVWDGDTCVGATTALPLADATDETRAPFLAAGEDVRGTLYFGESVVLASHRGRGLGVGFFAAREAHARALGLSRCAFCAVDRPDVHPLKPPDAGSNAAFWQRRGYVREPRLACVLEWRDLGEATPSRHTLTYWLKTL